MELTKTAENKTENDAWLSLVERYVRDVEVAGSNPVASIPWQGRVEKSGKIFGFFFYSVPAGVHLLLAVRLALTAIKSKKMTAGTLKKSGGHFNQTESGGHHRQHLLFL